MQFDARNPAAPPSAFYRYPVATFLALTFAITWSCVLAVAAGSAGLLAVKPSVLWLALVGQFGPAWAALLLTAAVSGVKGVANSWRSMLRPNIGAGPWLVIGLGPAATFFAAYGLHLLAGGRQIAFAETDWGRFAGILVGGSIIGLIFGGLSEEPGWRGYLLPRLQSRTSPLAASIVIGLIWAVWHLEPEVAAAGLRDGWSAFAAAWWDQQYYFFSRITAFAILMTAVYNRTRGSLFAMVVMHSLANAFESALPEHWVGLGSSMIVSRIAVDAAFALALLALWRRHEPVALGAACDADVWSPDAIAPDLGNTA